ncbi:MAG: glycolate oxidase subunit GlcE [Sulfuricaulis sp.]
MAQDKDIALQLAEAVKAAALKHAPLAIAGGGSKRFYTGAIAGEKLDVREHRGIVSYEPTELVISARAGTPLAEVEATLAEKDQMLGFEPPHFGAAATLGGAIACGFSGPRRPYAGAARDFVLGATIVNGRGELLRFGGQVMKNVAGYDVSRLMVGALGTLGVLLEISLKVLPKPAQEITLAFKMPAGEAISTMNAWAGRPLPLSAAAHAGDTLYVRLSGSALGVRAAQTKLGGVVFDNGDELWRELREQRHGFFQGDTPLWRLSVPPAAPPLTLPGEWLIDWGGAQRWIKTDVPAEQVHRVAARVGGHAGLFREVRRRPNALPPLPAPLLNLHRHLRQAFDPAGILNRELLYPAQGAA